MKKEDDEVTVPDTSVVIELSEEGAFESIFKKYEFKKPEMRCSKDNLVEMICTSEECDKPPFLCFNKTCADCHESHLYCYKIDFSGFESLMKSKANVQKAFIEKMFKVGEEIISKIQTKNESMIKKITLAEELHAVMLEKGQGKYKGKEINELVRKQKRKIEAGEEDQKELQKIFSDQSHRVVDQVVRLYDEVFRCFVEGRKEKENLKNGLVQEKVNFINSNLLSACLAGIYMNTTKYYQNMVKNPTLMQIHDEDRIASDKEYLTFLRESLYKPVRAELIFTASQHNFQAAKFHEKCDGVENTLTIVRTQFGKTIFAFAAQKWQSANAFVNDTTGKSCLLLLELKKKCSLTDATKSIYGNPSLGPRFGGGSDLRICDGCDKSNGSSCSFPTSYNCNGEFTNNQIAHTTICGAPNGYNFKVIDYEVHKLIYA